MQILEWFLTNSIYGIVGLASLAGGLTYLLRKRFSRIPNHTFVGMFVFVILIIIVPTYPRYQFNKNISEMLEKSPHVRVLNLTYWGAISEPLTWFFDFIGSVHTVGPESPIIGGFKRVVLRFEEKPRVSLEEPDCTDKSISISEPDNKGTFRYTSRNRKMQDDEKSLYCETDWSKEREALRKILLEYYKNNKSNAQ